MTETELFALKPDKPDEKISKTAKQRLDALAKPIDGFGILEDVLCRIAAIQGSEEIDLSSKTLAVFCADNGVVEEGISQTDASVTGKVAALLGKGKNF